MTTPISSFSGAISGIDWQSLVDKIIQADAAPQTVLKNEVTSDNAVVSAWQSYGQLLQALQTAIGGLRDGTAFTATTASVASPGYAGPAEVAATTSVDATPADYQVQVTGLAQAEKLSGGTYASASKALGLSGEFFVNGARISVAATDTLSDIRDKINAADTGTSATKVTASVLSAGAADNRLVLTSDVTGSAGIDLKEGASALLARLGFLDGTTTVKRQTSSGAAGDRFTSADAPVKTLLGLTDGGGPQTVTVGGQTVTIDLSTQSLNDVAASLDALSGVSATVQQDTSDGTTRYYLDVRGTTSFADSGHALELLGLVSGGQSAVAQQVQSDALTGGDAATPATATTALADLWNGGAAAGVQPGDTLTVTGTRGDGTAVNLTYTVQAGDTVQTLLDRISNATNGFGAGLRPAAAAIDAQGRITLTDGTAGDSRLALSIVAHNEGGGRLDLGSFTTDVVGRQRTLVAGADAAFAIDGVSMTRSTNTVADAIAGVTLTLQGAQSGRTWDVDISRDEQSASNALDSFAQAYDNMLSFVSAQGTPAASGSGQSNPPLYGDSTLSGMRSMLSQALIQIVPGAQGNYTTASSVGLSLDKNGQLSLDAAKFKTAFTDDYAAIQQLFVPQKTATDPAVTFTTFGNSTAGGSYDVTITSPATQATATGSGFSGVYADDGTPDTMVVTDQATGWVAQVGLSNGMTTAQIVAALNAAFAAAAAERLQSSTTLYADPSGTTPMTAATHWSDLTGAGGASLGIATGDTIAYGGTRSDGTAVGGTFTIGDPSTGAVGDFIAQIQRDIGTGATVSVANGRIVVQDNQAGASQLALTLTPGNQGGGSLSFGSLSQVTQGRTALPVSATPSGNDIVLTGESYGSAASFAVSFLPGGADGTAQLGLAAKRYAGTDVAGTIGGYAARGAGQQLTGATGTPVAGLVLTYGGTTARSAGQVSLTIGLAEQVGRTLDAWLDPTSGLLTVTENAVNTRISDLNASIASWDTRLAQERTRLTKEYTAMEVTIAKLQAQSASLTQQFFNTSTTSSSSSTSSTKGTLG